MAIEIKMPDIGIEKVEVIEILVKVGDKIELDQSLITVEGNKTSMEIPSSQEGIVKKINISVGDEIEKGKVIMTFDSFDEERIISCQHTQKEKKVISPIEEIERVHTFVKSDSYIHASPLIRRLAREFNVNLEEIKGTGHKGRILREDIQSFLKIKEINAGLSAIKSTTGSSNSLPNSLPSFKVDFEKFGTIKKVELTRVQKTSGSHLKYSWVTIPHVTHFDKADITELEDFRKKQNIEATQSGLDLKSTLLVFVIKIVSFALKQMPRFNSSLSEDNQYIILKKYINIGIAVDTPQGLLVPVLKDVNKKSISELSHELISISKKARDGKLTPNEMQGGCFTISNIGKLGTTYFSPIINPPEVAILGISKTAIEPVWNGEKFVPRLMLPISLSFDHRVIDGADGARFIAIIKNTLSDIRCLIM